MIVYFRPLRNASLQAYHCTRSDWMSIEKRRVWRLCEKTIDSFYQLAQVHKFSNCCVVGVRHSLHVRQFLNHLTLDYAGNKVLNSNSWMFFGPMCAVKTDWRRDAEINAQVAKNHVLSYRS